MTSLQHSLLGRLDKAATYVVPRDSTAHTVPACRVHKASQRVKHRSCRLRTKAESSTQQTNNAEDLEAQMEEFLKRQQEQESGQALAESQLPEDTDPVGTTEVSDEDAKRMCREIVKIARVLSTKRDMGLNELKLTVAVEDPRVKERRSMGIEEGDYGCSRDEMAAALVDVSEGRIPKDRIALRALYTDLRGWPFVGNEAELDEEGAAANYGGITNTGVQGGRMKGKPMKKLGRDPNEKPKSLTDMLPDWVGYSSVYVISAIPILIGGTVIAVLFFSSLR